MSFSFSDRDRFRGGCPPFPARIVRPAAGPTRPTTGRGPGDFCGGWLTAELPTEQWKFSSEGGIEISLRRPSAELVRDVCALGRCLVAVPGAAGILGGLVDDVAVMGDTAVIERAGRLTMDWNSAVHAVARVRAGQRGESVWIELRNGAGDTVLKLGLTASDQRTGFARCVRSYLATDPQRPADRPALRKRPTPSMRDEPLEPRTIDAHGAGAIFENLCETGIDLECNVENDAVRWSGVRLTPDRVSHSPGWLYVSAGSFGLHLAVGERASVALPLNETGPLEFRHADNPHRCRIAAAPSTPVVLWQESLRQALHA